MGSNIQTQTGELNAGLVHNFCSFGIHEDIPLALRGVTGTVGESILVQAEHTRNSDDFFDHRDNLRLFAHGHCNIAHGAGGNQGDFAGICLDQINDQVNSVLRAAGSRRLRQEVLCLTIGTMREWVFRGSTNHRSDHAFAHRNIRAANHFQHLQCIHAGHFGGIVAIHRGHRQNIQRLRFAGHHNGHRIVHARVAVENDFFLVHENLPFFCQPIS